MNPATQEFIHTNQSLREDILLQEKQQNEMRLQIAKLHEENKRLYRELKDFVCQQELLSTKSGHADLQQRLAAANTAKNAAVEMWQLALSQLEKQELQLVGKQSLVEQERSETGKVVDQVKEEYVKGLNVLSNEVSTYRNELSDATRELHLKTSDLEQCKSQLKIAVKEKAEDKLQIVDLVKSKEALEKTVESLKTVFSETESFLNSTKQEMDILKSRNSELSSLMDNLKEQNKNLRTEMRTLEKDAKESLLTAQEAILSRKEMSFREEQLLKDIEHLKSTVGIEADKLCLKNKAEIKKIQQDASEKVKSLMEEIESLHREVADRQSMFERACREKQALESKLELLRSEYSNSKQIHVSEEMCGRLIISEKRADKLEYRVRALEGEIQETRSAAEQEVKCLREERNSLCERLERVVKDLDSASSERLQLLEDITKLKKNSFLLENKLAVTKKRSSKEIALLKEKVRQKEETFSLQMHKTEESYKKAIADLQRLLETESGISRRRGEVLEDVIAQSETKIKEMHQTILHLKKHNEELGERVLKSYVSTWQ